MRHGCLKLRFLIGSKLRATREALFDTLSRARRFEERAKSSNRSRLGIHVHAFCYFLPHGQSLSLSSNGVALGRRRTPTAKSQRDNRHLVNAHIGGWLCGRIRGFQG